MQKYSDVEVAELQKQLAYEKHMRKMLEKYADSAEEVLESNYNLATQNVHLTIKVNQAIHWGARREKELLSLVNHSGDELQAFVF